MTIIQREDRKKNIKKKKDYDDDVPNQKKMKDTKILKSTDESHNEKQRFKILLVCIIF